MDYKKKKNINVFSFWKVRHVKLGLKAGVRASGDSAEFGTAMYRAVSLLKIRLCTLPFGIISLYWLMIRALIFSLYWLEIRGRISSHCLTKQNG